MTLGVLGVWRQGPFPLSWKDEEWLSRAVTVEIRCEGYRRKCDWRRGPGGDAFRIREQRVQLHRVQDHSAPAGSFGLRAPLQPRTGSVCGKGKRRAWAVAEGPQRVLERCARDAALRAVGRCHRVLSGGETWPRFVLEKSRSWQNECS